MSSWIPASRLEFGLTRDHINYIDGPSDDDHALPQNDNNNASTLDSDLLGLLDLVGPTPTAKLAATEFQNCFYQDTPAPLLTNHIVQLPLDNSTETIIYEPQQDDILKTAFHNSINDDCSSDSGYSSSPGEFYLEVMEPLPSSSGTQALKRTFEDDFKEESDCKKVRLSNSERCKKNREKKKQDLKAGECEARQLELTNECLKVKLEEMEQRVVKYRKIKDLIIFQARAGLTLTPAQHQRINNKVQEALIYINFGV